jgi:hypothetical protein
VVARERGPENAYPDRLPARQSLRTFVNIAKGPRTAGRWRDFLIL